MIVLPIPLITACILGFLLLRRSLERKSHSALSALLAICAIQGVIISLVQHYGVDALARVQPVTAAMIPGTAFVCFVLSAMRGVDPKADLWHILPVGFVAVITVFAPVLLDALIPALFAVYGITIWWLASKGPDGLPRLRLETAETPAKVWKLIGVLLLASAFSDMLIVAAQVLGRAAWQPIIISLTSSLMLLGVGLLSVSSSIRAPETGDQTQEQALEPALDHDLFKRVDDVIQREALYLDPDLTLDRLSRKLRVPAKQLSAAINAHSGENVSRYINALRIAAACALLRDGQTVTQAMFEAGFNTKSNFNREFSRIMKMTPTEWLSAENRG